MSTIPWKGLLKTLKQERRFTASCAVVAAAVIYYFWK
jgi:hypothetical protein